jgi:putative glutamine amidotransferase
MDRPVIGMCTAWERARWSVWDDAAALLPRNYIDAVHRAGGMAVLLPPDPTLAERPDQALDLIDGLMLAGGADIDPDVYEAERHDETVDTVPDRDVFEISLVRGALARDLPLLGICRGMQLINVARGGTVRQHLPEEFGHHEHRRAAGTFDGADHDVRLAEGSLAARCAGELMHATKSHHHQGVGRIGDDLEVTGWAVIDDLPEALEDPGRRYALGVQWHPEADEGSRLIASLVEAATAYRRERVGSPVP